MGIHPKLGLETGVKQCKETSHRTYIEDMKDHSEIRSPGHNLLLIARYMEETRERATPALFDNLVLDLRHGSAMERIVGNPLKK
jgi:hypothetical protein